METVNQSGLLISGQESRTANGMDSAASRSAEACTEDSSSVYMIAETSVDTTGHGDPSYGVY